MGMEISWVHKNLEVRKSKISGTGVFASKRISKGEKIAVFGGFVIDMKTLPKLKETNPRAYKTITDIGYQIDDDLIFAPTNTTQFSAAEYINHSCNPNCGFSSPITFTSMRDIQKGEELTMDYAICVTSKLLEMDCACASIHCRKKVTANDWRSKVLQINYKGFFQPYIQQKIDTLSSKK